MSTKNNPGRFDCYSSADPNEEMFHLLGRDRHASALVGLWALIREKEGEDPEQVAEARECASRLAEEAQRRSRPVLTLDALLLMAASLRPAAPIATGAEINAPPVEGDIVVSGRGTPCRLLKVFGPESPDQVRGCANVRLPRAAQITTIRYDTLRRALPEEVAAYHYAGGA